MVKQILCIFLGLICLFSCKKEEKKSQYTFQYKLAGKYYRDSSNTSDGYKMLDLRSDRNYCWTRQINGLDSNFCNGHYEQTSDTSLLWNDNTLVVFKITPIDSISKGIQLQFIVSPPMPALYGYYQ